MSAEDELSAPTVSGVLVRVLADVALRCGVAPLALLQGTLRSFQTRQPLDVRIPLSEFRAMLSRAIAITGEPALALRVGLQATENAFDVMAPLIGHVRDLRHAIQEASRFGPLVLDCAYLHLREDERLACVRLEFPHAHDATDRSLAELIMASFVRLLHAFGCGPADIAAARFEHARPSAYDHVYVEAFHGAARFSSASTEIEFAAHALDTPNLHHNPVLHALVRAQLEDRLARMSRNDDVVERLRIYLLNQPAAQAPAMPVAARALGLSVRTLRRRLDDEGLTYRGLVQDFHRDRACLMLRDPTIPLKKVALSLGFNDMTAFHKAFKRWTGVTASEYRETH